MPKIFFPSQYKKAILKKTKTVTIRIDSEIDKYKIDKTYKACSYSGADWKRKIKITKIKKSSVGDLLKFGIPQKSLTRLKILKNRA
jgi:uncharacterized protein YqfB (UPF0267 family)